MLKTSEIRIRDPFILPFDGTYYMYGTICLPNVGNRLYVYKSGNLTDWQEPELIFELPENFWGIGELWAPEVHIYKEKFYLFVSILGKNGLRGTQIAVSDSPCGMFFPITDKPATPIDKSCIDGTLYVENNRPYIVYSRDWPDNYVQEKGCFIGQICAVELSDDLREQKGEPFLLFNSDEAGYINNIPHEIQWKSETKNRYGSDAPFICKLSGGGLFLTWSPMPGGNYIVAAAVASGIRDEWRHLSNPVFDKNGGHAMFFTDFNGQLKMCIHCPEKFPEERALILDVTEDGDCIKLKQ